MHLWKVGDYPARNANCMHYEKNSRIFSFTKNISQLSLTMEPADIVLIVNYAWSLSFAIVQNNKKAILERG
jgi:hypothetical protein